MSILLTEFDVGLDIDWNLPRPLKKRFELALEKSVLKNYPSLPIASGLLKQKIPGADKYYELILNGVQITKESITLISNVKYS